ncbi:hypothetical protein GCM10023156_34600 [Novipirellula rosea]|uniref:Uncharacterized protein n=1 Tax=Novipirellula rosea TaxID=1031540 RepID=A0ABP8N001_9BACT
MQFSKLLKHEVELNYIAQYMIVIGKHDPGEKGSGMCLHKFIELQREIGESFVRPSYDRSVFEAGCGDEIDGSVVALNVGRRVSRVIALTAFGEDFGSLLWRPLPPPIHGIGIFGHWDAY